MRRLAFFLLSPLLNQRGAVTITTVLAGTDKRIADVEATADADTTATIPHGLGAVPLEVFFTPLLQAEAGLSLWAVTTIDATNVVLTKSVAVGSLGATPQIRVTINRPHTIGR